MSRLGRSDGEDDDDDGFEVELESEDLEFSGRDGESRRKRPMARLEDMSRI